MSKSKRLNRDHAKKTQRSMVEDRIIAEHLTTLLTPTIKSQSSFVRELGLRDIILTLPLMVAAVLTLLWRIISIMPDIKLKKFRKQLYHCLGHGKDAVFELSDAAILSRHPTSLAELSLSPVFRRQWHSSVDRKRN